MNLRKKLAMSLIAAGLFSAGAAQAAIEDFSTGNSSVVLSLVDSVSGVSALFDLGAHLNDLSANINTVGYGLNFDLASGNYATAFNSFLAASTNHANIKWNVISGDSSLGAARYLSTSTTADSSVIKTSNSKIENFSITNAYLSNSNPQGNHSSVTDGADQVSSAAGKAYFVNGFGADKWFNNAPFITLAALGTAQKFWYITDNGAGGTSFGSLHPFGVDTNGDGVVGANPGGTSEYGVWNVSTTGVVSFANPVPEADTWAMFAAGLIAVGAIARRRLSV